MTDLEVKNITVTYKKKIAVENASFEAKKSEIVGFIGADGAGKSSLMHAVAGIIKFKGEVVFNGYCYNSPKKAEKIRKNISLMPQGIGLVLYENLTVQEHIDFFANIRIIKKDRQFNDYADKLLHMAHLIQFKDREAKNLSGGMMQKLSLICSLLHKPKLLILDEPTTGVDPLSRFELWDILDRIRKDEGVISLISTAYMQEASKMDKILLFDNGEIIANGKTEMMINSISDFAYKKTPCKSKNCIELEDITYSLKTLDAQHKTPTLEGLFFVNALKKNHIPPKVTVSQIKSEAAMPNVVMEAKALTKRFGSFVANDRIDINLNKGEIVGLLGANGAGKTTFIKMLLGLLPIDDGELILLGKPIKNGKDRQRLKSKIGYVSQHFALYKNMSVEENLLYSASMHRIEKDEAKGLVKRYASELGFLDYLNYMPYELPLGINQRFSLAAAILHKPVVLFLDEPTSGVDVIARNQFWKLLKLLKKRWEISILITTHYMSEAEFCDRVVLLKNGRKAADDTVENLYKKHKDAKNFEEIFLDYFKDIQ